MPAFMKEIAPAGKQACVLALTAFTSEERPALRLAAAAGGAVHLSIGTAGINNAFGAGGSLAGRDGRLRRSRMQRGKRGGNGGDGLVIVRWACSFKTTARSLQGNTSRLRLARL